jgi:hypothetical protein
MLQNSEYIIDAVQMGGPRLAMNISFFCFGLEIQIYIVGLSHSQLCRCPIIRSRMVCEQSGILVPICKGYGRKHIFHPCR